MILPKQIGFSGKAKQCVNAAILYMRHQYLRKYKSKFNENFICCAKGCSCKLKRICPISNFFCIAAWFTSQKKTLGSNGKFWTVMVLTIVCYGPKALDTFAGQVIRKRFHKMWKLCMLSNYLVHRSFTLTPMVGASGWFFACDPIIYQVTNAI